MRTLKKVRKLSHDNFVESYGVVTRSKSVDGRTKKTPVKTVTSQSTEMYGTFRRRKNSVSSVDESKDLENDQRIEDCEDSNNNYNSNNNNVSSLTGSLSTSQVNISVEDDCQTPSLQAQSEVQYKGAINRRLRRFSLKKFPSTGDIHKAVSRRTRSEGADDKDDDGAQTPNENRVTSWPAQLSINKRLKTSASSLRSKSPKRALFRIPALRMIQATQSGYLDRRNKKKKWEKFWCVLQDSCLYCYNSPQSEFTQDATVLRGYIVSADMSDVQRAKFTFKLEKKGFPTYHFRTDNHKGFMQWICMIKKESTMPDTDASDNEILLNSVKNSTQALTRVQSNSCASSPPAVANNRPLLSRRHTADNIFMTRKDHLDLELQKENLLREVLEQQKEIIKERNSIMPSPKQARPYYVPLLRDSDSPKPTKDEVMEKYERVKETQQMKILKSLTQLHRRRNSVQLKIDQLSRDTRPKARRSRSASRYIIQSMEARLALLQSELAEIDQEIREQQANKEDIMDNINHKRDLEIMVLDQQECLDIVKREQSKPFSIPQERGRRPTRRQSAAPVSYMHEHLTSIDEGSTICQSDASSTSSGLSNSCSDLNSPVGIHASTPRHHKSSVGFDIGGEGLTSSDDCFRSCQSIAVSKSSSCSSDADEVMSVEGALSDDFRSLSTSSYSDLDAECRTRVSSSDESLGKKPTEIRPDVLAEIEDFEVFSKMMLQRLNSAHC